LSKSTASKAFLIAEGRRFSVILLFRTASSNSSLQIWPEKSSSISWNANLAGDCSLLS
jgi:hypothetical protein